MKQSNKHLYTCILFVLIAQIATVYGSGMAPFPQGKRQHCSNEGAIVPLNFMESATCYSCTCKNGYVECNNNCPKIDECQMIVDGNACCKICKGCSFNGTYYDSHTEWTDPSDPCTVKRCEGGILTISKLHCHTPCANPLPPEPGKCCPTCSECRINGQKAAEDRDVIPDDDPCLKCRCNSGKLICTKKACPVLQCHPRYQYHSPGECCPKCNGTRSYMEIQDRCLIQNNVIRETERITLDRCTDCECLNTTNVCRRISCPILDCAPEEQKLFSTQCCPMCIKLANDTIVSKCHYRGKDYEDGEEWPLDICSSCKCYDGKISCARTRCNTTCAAGLKKIKHPLECCPKCVEADGVCMAFGDPHYKSFDGKIYTFKGIGKYQLTKDCEGDSFSVKVANLLADKSTTTKRVAINFGDSRLNLQQRGRVKYNGKKISFPFRKEGRFRVTKVRDVVEVVLQNDVRFLWNGHGFLEITVPPTYKNKLCGLCGNFNGNVQDDLKTKLGQVVGDKDLLHFGTSWCIGNKTECAKKIKPSKATCSKYRVDLHPCRYVTSDIFSSCSSKLSYSKYYKACRMDMCHCPNEKCYCDSLMAYARECERLGVKLSNWQKESGCDPHHSRRITNHQRKKHQKVFNPKSFSRSRIPDIRQKSLRSPIPISK
ncbi:BMP-binding endothelial regulator protein-like [Sitophilus oryzae]|uniref:BMP-binding endothelial regulator protein-like n=1 Tax=Sitophilus oryzae TaxID=7048 RepID=A0A6J2XPN8_SITOR|nr:BMP-binding endothelial regulator protein-like [Sitophilus oryzae]